MPRTMRILGETWSVEVRDEDGDLDTRYAGVTNYRHKRIALLRQNPQQMKKTLLHELLHVVFDRSNLEKNSEADVLRCEHVLWAIMADNKEVFEWMLSDV